MNKNIITFKNVHELVTLIKRILTKLKDNPTFVNPPAALSELEKMLPELEVALVNAKSRDKEWVAIKNNKKAIALALLEELAAFVIGIAKDDRALILNSGFDVTDEQSGNEDPSIEILEVEVRAPGEATVRGKNKTGAVAYVFQYAIESPGANTMWHGEGSSTCNYTFTGLTSDKRYWFRVMAIGRKGQKAYSPIVSRAIQ